MEAEALRDDERVDRAVAAAFAAGELAYQAWTRYLTVRAAFYAMPEDRKDLSRLRLVQEIPDLRDVIGQEPVLERQPGPAPQRRAPAPPPAQDALW